MNVIYVLNQNLEIQGVIDEYISAIWRPSYSEIGDFELYLSADAKAVALLRKNWYLVRDCDISVVAGVVTYRKVMVVKNFDISTNIESGDFLTVTGRELKHILHQRIVWKQTTLSGTVESGIRQLITENAISPTDANRKMPNVVLGEIFGITETIDKQITGEYLDESIVDICTTYDIGWDAYITDGRIVFDVYKGTDRSYSQTEVPYVVFSDEFENLFNTSYQMITEEFANMTKIGGEGEGLERKFATVGDELAGFERFETFTDARDISQNIDSEDAISDEAYLLLLQERGRENLASLAITEGFSGEVLPDVAFVYEQDFFLGDLVTVVNRYGITRDVRVLSAIESESDAGTKLVPQFNI